MAYEILENNTDEQQLVLAGIRNSGTVMAKHIQALLGEISDIATDLFTITLDKDRPDEVILSKQGAFDDKVIIVIDDVAMSGKTLLYAMKQRDAALGTVSMCIGGGNGVAAVVERLN